VRPSRQRSTADKNCASIMAAFSKHERTRPIRRKVDPRPAPAAGYSAECWGLFGRLQDGAGVAPARVDQTAPRQAHSLSSSRTWRNAATRMLNVRRACERIALTGTEAARRVRVYFSISWIIPQLPLCPEFRSKKVGYRVCVDRAPNYAGAHDWSPKRHPLPDHARGTNSSSWFQRGRN